MPSKRTALGIVAASIAAALAPAAFGEEYPARPITMIVPFAAGGPTDMVARIVGEHMSKTLGRQIVIENVLGGGGTAATTRAMRAPADGYTIELGHMGTHAAAVALYPHLAYDPVADFAPIGLSAAMPILLLARKDFPARDLGEFIAYAKANPGRLNMAHAGVGSVSFTTCLLLNSMLNLNPIPVPYNGTGPAMNALIGGQVDYMCDQIPNVVAGIVDGTIKAYAVATPARSPVLPDVPTTREAGLPGFEVSAWNALFAPKGTPKPILDRLTLALDQALSDPATRKRLLELGCDIPPPARRGQQALAALVRSEIERWKPVTGAGCQNSYSSCTRNVRSNDLPAAANSKPAL